ncbi:MAG: Mitochondrial outer membrane protein iml2 [Chaenotheca gracillima]|nr:MAG: Mitochondrial outer membrane protein iml2 [Chaenotheca gracillima]
MSRSLNAGLNWILFSGGRRQGTLCLFCRHQRSLQTSSGLRAANKNPSLKASPAQKPASSPAAAPDATKPSSDAEKDPTPKQLSRPLGVASAPRPGENSGIDPRTLQQRRDDFVNYEKHIARRKELTAKISKPYFRDWSNMRHSKGKSFLAPQTLIRSTAALFFPNLQGRTLLPNPATPATDTTTVLEGKVSIVSLFSSNWAERQVATFTSPQHNPALHDLLNKADSQGLKTASSSSVASTSSSTITKSHPPQLVSLNIEPNSLKAMLIRLFLPSIRKQTPREQWDKYFVIRRGFTEDLMAALGVANAHVGYVFLIDRACRVRWVGSGDAEKWENEALVKGVRRLLVEETEATIAEAEVTRRRAAELAEETARSTLEGEKVGQDAAAPSATNVASSGG